MSRADRDRIDETHDPALISWVESANGTGGDFPIQNLPLGVFATAGVPPRIGVAIGDRILDLRACVKSDGLSGLEAAVREACSLARLNELMSLGRSASQAVRRRVSQLLREGAPPHPELLFPMRGAEMRLPAEIGDYTDFYASIHHATNVGAMFRPDHPLLPNYKYVPIGYHGRASSIVASGAGVRRPWGQVREDGDAPPKFAPSRLLDYELEAGFFVGAGNELGSPIAVSSANDRLFGACLVNDWSARDVQSWEYQPLGPFLAKSFATTVSPWVVTMDALEPFRVPASTRAEGDPAPLPHLHDEWDRREGGIDIQLEVYLSTGPMRSRGMEAARLTRGSFANLYWTPAQLVAHHASNGCNLRPGDLLASGTVSGPNEEQRGCLLELTLRGARPLKLPGGEERRFLEDGDEITLRGYCERDGYARIGFGECAGRVLPAAR